MLLLGIQNGTTFFGKQLVISLKLNGHLLCDPDILFLTFYSKEIRTYVYTNTYTGMFIEYLFVTFCNIQNLESIKIFSSNWRYKQTVVNTFNRILFTNRRASLLAQMVKNLPALQESQVWSLGQEDLLEKEMATHSSIIAWRIPWIEEPGGLPFMGLQRVRQDWGPNTFTNKELITDETTTWWISK